MTDFKTPSDFAFPGANPSEYTCGGLFFKSVQPKKCCDQKTTTSDLMEKDSGISNNLPGNESLVFRAKGDLKLGLNFPRSRIETACETELGLSRDSFENVEVVDLTSGGSLEDEEIQRKFSHADTTPRFQDYPPMLKKNKSEEEDKRQRKRKKSLLLQDLDDTNKRKRSDNFKISDDDYFKPRTSSFGNVNDDFFAVSDIDCHNQTYLGKRPLKDPIDIADLNGGKMLKIKKTKTGVKVSFTCKMNHRFSLMSHETEKWCKVCRKLYTNAKNHAELNNGKILNEKLERELTFQCQNGHKWKVSYKKCLRNWCKVCKKQRKKLVKEILKEENKKIEAEMKDKQEKMFHEARLKMLRDNQLSQEDLDKQIETFKILDEEISKVAKNYAKDFLKGSPESEFKQILELYKVLILPEKSIRLYFEALNRKKLKKEFRRYTILLHPDKNCHPKAKSAFQKIFEAFENALKKKSDKGK